MEVMIYSPAINLMDKLAIPFELDIPSLTEQGIKNNCSSLCKVKELSSSSMID